MFDTNIFNQIVDDNINIASLKQSNKYYTTHIQLDEISDTGDKERKSFLLGMFQEIGNEKVPTESAVWDVSKWDEAKFSNGDLYTLLLQELNKSKPRDKDNNIKDALIAETSIKNGFILVTADSALYRIVKNLGGSVLNWNEFLG